MMRLPTIALGALALSAISFTALSSPVDIDEIAKDEAAGRVGVIFTNAMPIDRSLVHSQLIQGKCEKSIVVISGVKEMEKAHGYLHDFLSNLKFPLSENVIFVQGDRLTVEKPHERNFVGEPIPLKNTFEDIIESGFIRKDDNLIVTHFAPTPKEYIKKLAGNFRFRLFHLFLEKPQDPGSSDASTLDCEDPTSSDAATLDCEDPTSSDAATLDCEDPTSTDAITPSWIQEIESTIKHNSPDAYTLVTAPISSYLRGKGRFQ